MMICVSTEAAFVQINQVTLTAVTYGAAQKVCLKSQPSNMHSRQLDLLEHNVFFIYYKCNVF